MAFVVGTKVACGVLSVSLPLGSTPFEAPKSQCLTRDPTADANAAGAIAVKIAPLPGATPSGVSGVVVISQDAGSTTMKMEWQLSGVEASKTAQSAAGNSLGVHVHSGTGCASADQGGHFYNMPVSADPWGDKFYQSTAAGTASGSGGRAARRPDGSSASQRSCYCSSCY